MTIDKMISLIYEDIEANVNLLKCIGVHAKLSLRLHWRLLKLRKELASY